jgi:hypothetical protein
VKRAAARRGDGEQIQQSAGGLRCLTPALRRVLQLEAQVSARRSEQNSNVCAPR